VKKRAAAWAKGLAKYVIGIGLLAYVIGSNWNPTFAPPNEDGTPGRQLSPGLKWLIAQPPDYLAAFALFALGGVVFFTQFIRWYYLVRALDLPFSMWNAFRLGLVGLCFNFFLPGSIGGDLMKAFYVIQDHPERKAAAVSTIIADRLIGLFGLIWISAAFGGLFWLSGDPLIEGNEWLKRIIRICAGLTAFGVVVWIVLGFVPQRNADLFASRLSRIPKLGKTLAEVWFAVWTYRQRPKVIYALIALTGFCHVSMVLMFHFAVRVFPTADPATIAQHFVVAPVGYIAQAFFPAPGGVGGAEAIFGYLYEILGLSESTGVIGRLTMRVVEWSFGIVGLVVWLRMRKELPAVEADSLGEAAFGGEGTRAPATDAVK
jgi:uncharacterized membrane protein YbhN (UPF0104 family)